MPAYSREAPAQRAEERILSLQMWKVVPPIGMGGEKLAGGRPTELQPPSVGLGGRLPAQPLLPQSRVGTPFGLSITSLPRAVGVPTSERAIFFSVDKVTKLINYNKRHMKYSK